MPVSLLGGRPGHPDPLVTSLLDHPVTDPASALAWARTVDAVPGSGETRQLWEALATAAAIDLGAARAMEPHLDAIAILAQAEHGVPAGEETWGVYAAEGGEPLRAHKQGDSWIVTGTKQWCSLAGSLDLALVSATRDDDRRGLFAVALRGPGVQVEEGSWHARGLAEIPSGPVHFTDVSATPIGEPGWYLERPGFSWGGMAVAACWYGGAVGLARSVFSAASSGKPFLLMHLGAIDELLESGRRALAEGAALVDSGEASGARGRLLTKRVRATVARAVEETLTRVGHALGPAPLALDKAHSKRVADLELYVRQHHAEKDQAALGETLLRSDAPPW
ncbi:acyl-CoA dehydrogenase family protein [Lacisediminihabitans sp. G11-30]|uniref:Acyl-CoA dehydrogenase family protein n=2 Tax=Lacisediminihabitans changchengi TaxID=2787634 RepID=A0A934SLS3_9MICO|nr:acyl-CoA dehydrogenase family protein [Lacisediminihabitans changchengi]